MSEQHAERFEELDSAHSRLDAILDQLSALGTTDVPAEAETPEPELSHPTRALRSVPDLEPLIPPALPDLPSESPTVEDVVLPSEELDGEQAEDSELIALQEQQLEQVDESVVVEYHELEITPTPDVETESVDSEPSMAESANGADHEDESRGGDDQELVFMLDGPLKTEQLVGTSAETDVLPVVESEFAHTELDEPEFPEAEFAEPESETVENNDDVDAGWVSHHEADHEIQVELVVPTIEDAEEPLPAVPSFGAPEWAEEPSSASEEPAADVGLFDVLGSDEPQPDETSEAGESEYFDVEGASGLSELEMELMIDDPEEALHQDGPTPDALSSEVLGTDFASVTADSVEDGDPTGYESLFETDEELPLPDFTGVWADEDAPESVWDQADAATSGNVPDPVEQGSHRWGISVGRNELDSLRPVDEEVVAVEPARVARKLQLVMVVLFGLIALAVIFLDDPAVVDDLRDLYDGFFG